MMQKNGSILAAQHAGQHDLAPVEDSKIGTAYHQVTPCRRSSTVTANW